MKSKRNYKVRYITDIRQMLRSSVEIYGDHTAFLVKDDGVYRPISYKRFRADVEGLGTALCDLGYSGKRIVVIGENSYEWSLTYMTTVCGLGVIVPVDKELPIEEISNIVNLSQAALIVYADAVAPKIESIRGVAKISFSQLATLVEKGEKLIASGEEKYLNATIDPDVLSILLFTSGTTGVSKGVMLSQTNICFDLMQMCMMCYIDDKDVFLSVLPLHHTYECTCGFLCQIYRGSTIAYGEGLRYITKNMQEAKVTMMLCVPILVESMYKKIWQGAEKKGKAETLKKAIKINNALKKTGIDMSKKLFKDIHNTFGGHLRMLISGGAAVDPQIMAGLRDLGINAIQGYGLTECAPIAALNRDHYFKDDSAGLAPPDGKLEIFNPGPDGTGEIRYKGPNVMLGYFNAPELTAEIICDGWLYTGDLGYIDKEGFLHITGRKKNVIITSNGKNVFPEELETYLARDPFVKESVIVGIMNERKRDYDIVAIVVPDEEKFTEEYGPGYTGQQVKAKLEAAVEQVNQIVPAYKRMAVTIVRNEEFVKNTSRKIKRFGIIESVIDEYKKIAI